jgi:hypothetical protein
MQYGCQGQSHNIYNKLGRSFILIHFHFGRAVSRPLAITSSLIVNVGDAPAIAGIGAHGQKLLQLDQTLSICAAISASAPSPATPAF